MGAATGTRVSEVDAAGALGVTIAGVSRAVGPAHVRAMSEHCQSSCAFGEMQQY